MATYTYAPAGQFGATGYFLFTDKGLANPATLLDANGNPLPSNQVNLNGDGTWPTVQSTASPLWFVDEEGTKIQINPGLGYGAPVAVTGAKGSNAALGSLIAALISVGVPITDQTTA